ncbi:Uncharacterised protein [Candidatus Bilamarchaeum dharawalense]|uniref:Uncharacterized protein n=1 Tax=Candidatus Bilamarchaeum dharawalense TaxID=2885759 RepID=A0A5E4LUG2_9ARCH|nr:Uncharacterised protein [Candidatus Bilamarchaeum dharawalense]
MGIAQEETKRMIDLVIHPYFSLGLVLLSIGSWSFGYAGSFFSICVAPLLIEIVGWLAAIVAAYLSGYAATSRKGSGIITAAINGSVAMVLTNFPRHIMTMVIGPMIDMLSYGGGFLFTTQGTAFLIEKIVILLVISAVPGFVIGTIGGFFGKSSHP